MSLPFFLWRRGTCNFPGTPLARNTGGKMSFNALRVYKWGAAATFVGGMYCTDCLVRNSPSAMGVGFFNFCIGFTVSILSAAVWPVAAPVWAYVYLKERRC